jgi:enamine deaminase RidA (YjgF/YER057c/UK114 family)
MSWPIERGSPSAAGRSSATGFGPFVWAVATAADASEEIGGQTRATLEKLDRSLALLGTDRARLLSVQIFLLDMAEKDAMDAVWCEWVGPDPSRWPQRACVGAPLAPGARVEIVVLAARQEPTT